MKVQLYLNDAQTILLEQLMKKLGLKRVSKLLYQIITEYIKNNQ
jgi:hypothetical protein